MEEVKEAQRAYIQKAMDALGLDATNLARRADLAPSTLNRFLNKPVKHQLSGRTLAAISRASGLPVPQDAIGSPDAPDIDAVAREAEPAPNAIRRLAGAGDRNLSNDMIPIRGGARGGNEQEMFLDEVIGYTARPGSLMNVKDGYSMYMVGDSMSPRYEPGWLLHINPHKPPKPGRDVVVEKRNGAVMVKTLVSWRNGQLELRSINERDYPDLVTVADREVKFVHVVVGADQEG